MNATKAYTFLLVIENYMPSCREEFRSVVLVSGGWPDTNIEHGTLIGI